MWKATVPIWMVGLMILVAACAAEMADTPGGDTAQTPQPSTLPPALQGAGGSPGKEAAQRAKDDLGERLNLEDEAIAVISVEAVDWPDASLGCPEPGKLYAQVVTPGYIIVLEAEGQRHEYHSDSGAQQLIHCPDDQERLQTMRAKSSAEQAPLTAQQDLATRLAIPVDQITILRVTEEEFPAGDLGCPCPGCPQSPMTGLVSALRIILKAGNKEYEYRARGMAVLFCGER